MSSLDIAPLTPHMGAEIGGIDLTRPLSPRQVAELQQALADHLVIFFRDQPLSLTQQIALGRCFGELHVHPGLRAVEGHPEAVRIHADANSRYVAGEDWHSDLTCDPRPPMGSILHLHTVPAVGGDTLFANMVAAYDALSPRMKTYLLGLSAQHDGSRVFAAMDGNAGRQFPAATHPVVRTHPVTRRRALFVNKQFTAHIHGLPKDESRAVLDFLFAHAARPEFQMRFRWRPHSVAFWDNRCAQHTAIWDYFPHARSGHRVTVQGDAPFCDFGAA